LQKPETFAKWRDETPDGFVFSLKAPRFTTNRDAALSVCPVLARLRDSLRRRAKYQGYPFLELDDTLKSEGMPTMGGREAAIEPLDFDVVGPQIFDHNPTGGHIGVTESDTIADLQTSSIEVFHSKVLPLTRTRNITAAPHKGQ
jgi:Protein of unknown function DUF72